MDTANEGNLSMTILCNTGFGAPLWRAQIWANEHMNVSSYAFDPRLAVIGLMSQALNAAWKNTAGRAAQGARFAHRLSAADTMVAAGGR
jgi:hypothetical protein